MDQSNDPLAGMTLEGIVDNRLKIVSEVETADVLLRHSDRDLLDADQATEIDEIPKLQSTEDSDTSSILPLKIRDDAKEDRTFKGRAFLQRQLLTTDECQAICEAAEAHAGGLSRVELCGGKNRICNRVAFRSTQLDKILWNRVSKHLDVIFITPENSDLFLSRGMEGKWKPTGLSGVYRVVKYTSGGHIAPHFDGEFVASKESRSIKTILIYLNEGYEEGRTNFLDHRDDDIGLRYFQTANGATQASPDDIIASVPIETGIGVVFDAKMLHEGTTLKSGTKWLLRADIVYTRIEHLNPPDSPWCRATDELSSLFQESTLCKCVT
eukprot:TRINITY_DN6025_c0_g1_i5.p1 TRINITY_DN6025_c0_g1~~TRINITY_DN6025_c0_g1_i5.p1  ORF type:complete len:325 (+),score=56.53 TRINITY_DN6025_c0_g1_i5:55-1029(+)